MPLPVHMPIIDFHMHAFPDKIAERTLDKLAKISNSTPYTAGTIDSTLDYLSRHHLTAGVIMQIATKPTQQTTVNNWAKQVQTEHEALFCFGSIHPDAPDALEELYRIRELGLKGVKLHPDYQNFFVNEERLYPIYETIAKLGLPVTFHAGWDPLSPDCIHAMPEELAKVADAFPSLTIIAAHMGGMRLSDDVERYLVGKPNVYLDFSMAPLYTPADQLKRIIEQHGAERILFATDCPWSDASQDLDILLSLGLSDEAYAQILHRNAERLLAPTD